MLSNQYNQYNQKNLVKESTKTKGRCFFLLIFILFVMKVDLMLGNNDESLQDITTMIEWFSP